jgi:hypothetical protein
MAVHPKLNNSVIKLVTCIPQDKIRDSWNPQTSAPLQIPWKTPHVKLICINAQTKQFRLPLQIPTFRETCMPWTAPIFSHHSRAAQIRRFFFVDC